METIIHIGQHKTGTTSLQHILAEHSLNLRQQKCYYTNSILNHVHNSHYILNVYALGQNRFSSMKENIIENNGIEYIERLNKQLPLAIADIYAQAVEQNCDKIIWSNEGLYLLNSKTEYEKLFRLFKPFSSKTTVACCFREKKSYQKSYVKELEKQNISLSNNPDSYKYLENDSWLFDYDRKRKILKDVFDECLFWDYNEENNTQKFLELINVEIKGNTNTRLNVTESSHLKLSSILKKIRTFLK